MGGSVPSGLVWAVSVEGDESDLLASARYFADVSNGQILNISLNSNPPRWVLMSGYFEGFSDEAEVASEAQAILDVMNGLLFVDDYLSLPILLTGSVHKRASNGAWGVAMFVPSSQMRIGSRRGSPAEQSELLAKVLGGTDELRKALTYVAYQPGWFDIYMAIECLERMSGGEHNLLRQPWATELSIKLLKQSANFHRHASAYDPPGRLSLTQARQSIAKIVRTALQTVR
jgi:hypothetical protein